MAKTDFGRVESILDQEMRRQRVQGLLKEASTASAIGDGHHTGMNKRKRAADLVEKQRQERRNTVAAMKFEIDQLFKKGLRPYSAMGTHYDEINGLFARVDTLADEEVARLDELKTALERYKESQRPKKAPSNDTLVENERERHINKRFNVSDGWLPLH